jgi:hypothetical protein
MPAYLQKAISFFKTNERAKDLLIGSVGAVIGGLSGWAINRLVRKND